MLAGEGGLGYRWTRPREAGDVNGCRPECYRESAGTEGTSTAGVGSLPRHRAVLALSRVALLVWAVHRYVSHTVTDTAASLLWCFYPELLLADGTGLGVIHVSRSEALLMWSVMLTLGSLILATPILLVGWLAQRRRSP
jgi:hypothetical protein